MSVLHPVNLQSQVKIPVKDICEALGITYAQLRNRINDGTYPQPQRDHNRRFFFTLGWLDIARIRNKEIEQVLLRVEQHKLNRIRHEEDIKGLL